MVSSCLTTQEWLPRQIWHPTECPNHAACYLLGLEEFNTADTTQFTSARRFALWAADRFVIRGTDVDVDARAVLSVAMVPNELCTNAVKYGALSNTTGHVEITGTPTTKHHVSESDEKAPCLKIVWTEKGGPTVHEPRQRSFGTRLIEQSFGELLGAARMRFEPEGVICEFDVPLTSPTPPQSD